MEKERQTIYICTPKIDTTLQPRAYESKSDAIDFCNENINYEWCMSSLYFLGGVKDQDLSLSTPLVVGKEDKGRELLESALNALLWYEEEYPASTGRADRDIQQEIKDYLNSPQNKDELKKELNTFFDWYKKSPFSSSGKTSDLIDVYMGDWEPTATTSGCAHIWGHPEHSVYRCIKCGKYNC